MSKSDNFLKLQSGLYSEIKVGLMENHLSEHKWIPEDSNVYDDPLVFFSTKESER